MERRVDLELRRNTSMEKLDTQWSWNKVGTSPNSIPILSQAALIGTACRVGQPGTRMGQVGARLGQSGTLLEQRTLSS